MHNPTLMGTTHLDMRQGWYQICVWVNKANKPVIFQNKVSFQILVAAISIESFENSTLKMEFLKCNIYWNT